MKYKSILRICLISLIFITIAESAKSDFRARWRPFRKLIKRNNQFKNYRDTVKRATSEYSPGGQKTNLDSQINKTVQAIQDVILSLRSENAQSLRSRREKKKLQRRTTLAELRNRAKSANSLPLSIPKIPAAPTKPEAGGKKDGSDTLIIKNLKNLRDTSRNLAQKGLEILGKALLDEDK